MHAIGVDLGGTKIEAALVDKDGNKLESFRIPTEVEKGWEKITENLFMAIEKVNKGEVLGIGIGTPGYVYDNRLDSAPNVADLNEVLVRVKEKYPNVIIENDANCFALAEHKWGAGRGCDNMIGLIWGTGIGGGLIVNGKLVKGVIGGAGEIGHITIDHTKGEYREGGPGTWEYYCSGPNIVRRYREAGGPEEDDSPEKIKNKGDALAEEVMQETYRLMGVGLGSLVNILNPEVIVIGGGVSNLNVQEEVDREMRKHCIADSGTACKVLKNELGDSSGLLGAAALVFHK